MNEEQELKGKRLLIMAGAGVHYKVVEAAKEMGVYTIVTDCLAPEDSPSKQIADEYWMYNIMDVDAIVARCKAESVDGVLDFCIDPAQRPYAYICEKLGLPCYGTKEQFDILTNKNKFKVYCREHDVDTIPDYMEEQLLAGDVEFPVLVKPVDSRASRGLTVCYDMSNVKEAISYAKSTSFSGKILIEKCMKGCLDSATVIFVANGEPYLYKHSDRFLGEEEYGLDRYGTYCISPSRETDSYMENVDRKLREMIRSLGIKFGPVFIQGFHDGNTVRYYDPAFRFPGTDYEMVTRKVTGVDFMKIMIKFALTGKTTVDVDIEEKLRTHRISQLNGHMFLGIFVMAMPGTIAKIEGVKELRKKSCVVEIKCLRKVGTEIKLTGDSRQVVLEIAATSDDTEELKRFSYDVYNTIKIISTEGKDMLYKVPGNTIEKALARKSL